MTSKILSGLSKVLALTPALGAALPLSFLLMSSILPVIKVLLIAATGLLFAQPHIGVLSSGSRHSLSKLVFTIFLPAIIFVNLGEAITPQKLLEWWFIPVNVIIASVVGCTIGLVVAKITNVPPEFSRITFILTGIGNMGNMPLVLVTAVCSDSRNPFGNEKSCNQIGTAYISLGMWMAAIIMWLFAYNILAPPQEWLPGYEGLPVKDFESEEEGSVSRRYRTRFSTPTVEPIREADDDEFTTPGTSVAGTAVQRLYPTESLGGSPGVSDPMGRLEPLIGQRLSRTVSRASEKVLTSVLESRLHYWMRTLHIYDMLRPPVLAAFIAMVMGMVPFLDHTMFSPDGALRFLTDAISILGQAMIPCILLVLGGNLVGGPGSSKLSTFTTAVIVVTRLLVIPCVGIVVVLTADRLGFLPPDDKMFRFVLFLQHTMPSSIQIGTACSLRGFGEKEVSAVLFYQHLAAVVTMAVFLFIYFFILFGG